MLKIQNLGYIVIVTSLLACLIIDHITKVHAGASLSNVPLSSDKTINIADNENAVPIAISSPVALQPLTTPSTSLPDPTILAICQARRDNLLEWEAIFRGSRPSERPSIMLNLANARLAFSACQAALR